MKKFQRSVGIKMDGVAGPQTYKALETALVNKTKNSSSSNNSGSTKTESGSSDTSKNEGNNSPPPTETGKSTTTLVQEGSRGDTVTQLQSQLKVLGHFQQEPTGFFGEVTKTAIIKFQKEWGLVADGLVSQATWNKLDEVANIHVANAEKTTSAKPVANFNVLNVIADASNYMGIPYLWGGSTSAGFDCSGFIQYVFKNNGVHLPRTVAEQWNATTSVTKLQVGDIVYFETYKKGPSHNGIYIGNNQFIHSGSSTGITISNMNTAYWSPKYLGAKRIVQ